MSAGWIPVLTLTAVLWLGLWRGGHAESAIFYLSTRGNDHWSGELAEPNAAGTDGPLATLAAAAPPYAAQVPGAAEASVEVCLRGGTYYLHHGLVLTAEDSGTEACPVTYRAHVAEKPVLCGGLRLSQWKPYRGEIFSAALPGDRLDGTLPKQPFYRGVRQVLARISQPRSEAPATRRLPVHGSARARERQVVLLLPPGVFPRIGRERKTWKSKNRPHGLLQQHLPLAR